MAGFVWCGSELDRRNYPVLGLPDDIQGQQAQIFIADGSARCLACLHIFKAEQYFVSPLLDKTERLDIDAEY